MLCRDQNSRFAFRGNVILKPVGFANTVSLDLREGGNTMKKSVIGPIACLVLVIGVGNAAGVPPYHSGYDFLHASPGTFGFGLYGYVNPALLGQVEYPDVLFTWSDQDLGESRLDRWGLFIGAPRIGFGMIRQNLAEIGNITDYRISMGFGDKRMCFGAGYGWSTGCRQAFGRRNLITLGMLVRPLRHLSVGASGEFVTSSRTKQGVIDIGFRPFGNELATFFADYALKNDQRIADGSWSAGAAFEIVPGIRLTGRYFDTHAYSIGLSVAFGRTTLAGQSHCDDDGKHLYNTFAIRSGSLDRSIIRQLVTKRRNYLKFDLHGGLKYQRFRLFDKSNTVIDLLNAIDAAKEDESVAGIAINTSGMNVNWEIAWELRQKLEEFKHSGKHVVIFIDDASLMEYYLASVADKIVMDPVGELMLRGVRFGRSYLKGTLEKLGLGFDEWRFFKYKSAYEVLSRDDMSEADREQLQAIADDFYELARSEICEARGFTPAEFDRFINEEVFFMAEDAKKVGLIDAVGRWDEVKEVIEDLEGTKKGMIDPSDLTPYNVVEDNYWGEKPKVAIVYALGVCAMDTGIKARSLSKVLEQVTNDNSIKAVVFRVDSPGGSVTASDIVAEALKKCAEKKPVIVSQGYVAGSGGYWISMYGDRIIAAPNTITGSIGVIGGWIYNKGFKEKLGMSTDIVKVGDHADLGFGVTLPLLGTIPDRNLTAEERAKVETSIKKFYRIFVEKVASGRKMDVDEVKEIAQGRIWSGVDGKEIGLVDEIGGLDRAIEIAKEEAGISKDQDVTLVQLPKPPLLNPNMFVRKLIGVQMKTNPLVEELKFRIEHNGEAMPLMPFDISESIRTLGY